MCPLLPQSSALDLCLADLQLSCTGIHPASCVCVCATIQLTPPQCMIRRVLQVSRSVRVSHARGNCNKRRDWTLRRQSRANSCSFLFKQAFNSSSECIEQSWEYLFRRKLSERANGGMVLPHSSIYKCTADWEVRLHLDYLQRIPRKRRRVVVVHRLPRSSSLGVVSGAAPILRRGSTVLTTACERRCYVQKRGCTVREEDGCIETAMNKSVNSFLAYTHIDHQKEVCELSSITGGAWPKEHQVCVQITAKTVKTVTRTAPRRRRAAAARAADAAASWVMQLLYSKVQYCTDRNQRSRGIGKRENRFPITADQCAIVLHSITRVHHAPPLEVLADAHSRITVQYCTKRL
eukprot:IDg11133t1